MQPRSFGLGCRVDFGVGSAPWRVRSYGKNSGRSQVGLDLALIHGTMTEALL